VDAIYEGGTVHFRRSMRDQAPASGDGADRNPLRKSQVAQLTGIAAQTPQDIFECGAIQAGRPERWAEITTGTPASV